MSARFYLDRLIDESGVSGTGMVAEGVEFTDGVVVLRWLTAGKSTCVYDSLDVVESIHGHNGATLIRWVD